MKSKILLVGALPIASLGLRETGFLQRSIRSSSSGGEEDAAIKYYSRENCVALGLIPKWKSPEYSPETHFEKLFKTPLNIDLLASAHSGNETGFEQVTADWGCGFDDCYGTGEFGTGCESIGFFGPGAKDPAGGGCPRGPVRVYEDLTCALKLGLSANPESFKGFCDITNDSSVGMFECLSFFANVLTETGAFAETEERDPRPYCWNREDGNSDCCPDPSHQPCLPDSDKELSSAEYPKPYTKFLTDSNDSGKCCSYHGRGFLQVSYEPNYKALSKALFGDETILWNRPYKLKSDGVMGWSAALWFWFNEHPAQVGNEVDELVVTSPRDEIYKYDSGSGLPGAINVINGGECSGALDPFKAFSRVSYFFAIAHRLSAIPPSKAGEAILDHYPLPGTTECEENAWCKNQFHNRDSVCPLFSGHIDCTSTPYLVNASTPMGFNRKTIKMTQADGKSPICQEGFRSGSTPSQWLQKQEDFTPIQGWEEMLDITTENVCKYIKLMYEDDSGKTVEGQSKYCTEVCYKDFAWDVSLHGKPCEDIPHQPCKTMAEYVSHPLPERGWESGDMGGYQGGPYLGRVGPGLVMALNGVQGFSDGKDYLCYHFGATACLWSVAMGCAPDPSTDVHNCKIFPPSINEQEVLDSFENLHPPKVVLAVGERPGEFAGAFDYYDEANCPEPTGSTILEQLFPRGAIDMDYLFSVHYSQSDGFANLRFDEDKPEVNKNSILYGMKGPSHVWKKMLCAFQLGVPSDPDFFKRHFGKQFATTDTSFPLSEDEKRFAQMEFIAMAANMIKETGALGQFEEQDPRCYCNYQGGAENPCCPNDWGNNPACYTTTDSLNPIISSEEMKRGTTTLAECCSYHGRGGLQTSYEKNYGDLGEFILENPSKGITAEMGRQYLLNYPQDVDAFGITGWTTTFAFWLHEHPCQYCDGRNTSTLDWNANSHSPHEAMVRYDEPGQGLGLTFTIINGVECESPLSEESSLSYHGGQMRLSLFYNLAYRLKVKAPGEQNLLPLPGTIECDESPFCRGTFYADPDHLATYRGQSGGCWALTPQAAGSDEMWPYCEPYSYIKGQSKLGAELDLTSFSLKKTSPDGCEMLHEYRCGAKKINPQNKPSMLLESSGLIGYTAPHVVTTDYDDPKFLQLQGMDLNEVCPYAVDRDPTNQFPLPNQNCEWWCRQPSGGGNCKAMDLETCTISGSGSRLVDCINKFYQTLDVTKDCEIQLPDDVDGATKPPTTPEPELVVACKDCSTCVSESGYNDSACSVCGKGQNVNQWPCNQIGYCICGSGGDNGETEKPDVPTGGDCDVSCPSCVSTSGLSWEDDNCAKCANGTNLENWPCSEKGYCQCKPGASLTTTAKPTVTTTTTTTTTTKATTTTTTTKATTTTTTTKATTTTTTTKATTTTTTTKATTTTTTTKATVTTTTTQATDVYPCETCDCVSVSGLLMEDDECEVCGFGDVTDEWPCNVPWQCRCITDEDIPWCDADVTDNTTVPPPVTTTTTTTTTAAPTTAAPTTAAPTTTTSTKKTEGFNDCDTTCTECVSVSGLEWEDPACVKCAEGKSQSDWPCQTAGYCKCKSRLSMIQRVK